jgi:histidinol-phosphate aminotransferase
MVERLQEHGGLVEAELSALELSSKNVLDFSVNVNPYGPSPFVAQAVREACLSRYPDPTSERAREALARRFKVSPRSVMVANGAVELLWSLARKFAASGTPALIVEPTFSEFRRGLQSVGARSVEWRAGADLCVDVEAIVAFAHTHQVGCIYLCNPGNPSGSYVSSEQIEHLARSVAPAQLIVDQSFLSLTRFWQDAFLERRDNVVLVRSLTKDHALAGLRVGYLLAAPALVAELEAQRPPWSTSSLAEAAIIATCQDTNHVDDSRERWLLDRKLLQTQLAQLGLQVLPSETPYFLVHVGDAAALRQRLLQRYAILVRDCTSFGLSAHLRLCGRPEADRARLLNALKEDLSCR